MPASIILSRILTYIIANSRTVTNRQARLGAGRSRVFVESGFNLEDFLAFFFLRVLAFSLGVLTINLEALSFSRLFSFQRFSIILLVLVSLIKALLSYSSRVLFIYYLVANQVYLLQNPITLSFIIFSIQPFQRSLPTSFLVTSTRLLILVRYSLSSLVFRSFRYTLVSLQYLLQGPRLVASSYLLLIYPISSSAANSSLLNSLFSSTLFYLRFSGIKVTFYTFLLLFFFFLEDLEDFLVSFKGVLITFLKLFIVSQILFLVFLGIRLISQGFSLSSLVRLKDLFLARLMRIISFLLGGRIEGLSQAGLLLLLSNPLREPLGLQTSSSKSATLSSS